jgi:hypothetical protein
VARADRRYRKRLEPYSLAKSLQIKGHQAKRSCLRTFGGANSA